jgi:hypothetical protein
VRRLKNGLSVEHPIAGDELRAIKQYLATRTDPRGLVDFLRRIPSPAFGFPAHLQAAGLAVNVKWVSELLKAV